jgi:5-hydroxyisourate hydrolase
MTGHRLAIHVVDATRETAAAGLRVEVYHLGSGAAKLCTSEVGGAGFVDDPVLASDAIVPGEYEIVFHVGEFYRRHGVVAVSNPTLDAVPFRFAIASTTQPCRVPVRISPWGFAVGRESVTGSQSNTA